MKTKITNTITQKSQAKQWHVYAATVIASFCSQYDSKWRSVFCCRSSDEIHASREASASVDQLWNIIANVDDPKYWSQIHTMKIIKRICNTIEADTTVGPFNAKGHVIMTLHPKRSVITNFTEGPVIGTRAVTLSPLSENKTKIDAHVEYRYAGIPFFGRGFAKDNFMKTTEDALDRISQAAALQ